MDPAWQRTVSVGWNSPEIPPNYAAMTRQVTNVFKLKGKNEVPTWARHNTGHKGFLTIA